MLSILVKTFSMLPPPEKEIKRLTLIIMTKQDWHSEG